MAPEQPRDQFEAALRAKIAKWQAALDSYLAAVAQDSPVVETTGAAAIDHVARAHGKPMDLPVGVFRDKKMPEAIEILLRAGRRKQTNKEIAAGLKKGGFPTVSASFESTVATALGRLKDDGIVLRFPDGWDLAASYPDSLRSRLDSKGGSKAKRQSRRSETKVPAKKARSSEDGPDKTRAVQLVIVEGQADGLTARQIVDALHRKAIEVTQDYVRVVTKRLRERQLIEQREGKFFPKAVSLNPSTFVSH